MIRGSGGVNERPAGPVIRRVRLSTFVIGVVALAGVLGGAYLFLHQGRMPVFFAAFGLLLGVAAVLAILRPFGNACAHCGLWLKPRGLRFRTTSLLAASQRLRGGDLMGALDALGPLAGDGNAYVHLEWCASCRAVAVWQAGAERVELGDEIAPALIARFGIVERDGSEDER